MSNKLDKSITHNEGDDGDDGFKHWDRYNDIEEIDLCDNCDEWRDKSLIEDVSIEVFEIYDHLSNLQIYFRNEEDHLTRILGEETFDNHHDMLLPSIVRKIFSEEE